LSYFYYYNNLLINNIKNFILLCVFLFFFCGAVQGEEGEEAEAGGGGMEAEGEEKGGEEVMSEVHLGCPPGFTGPFISHFTVSFSANTHLHPSQPNPLHANNLHFDQDGDLLLPRRRSGNFFIPSLTISFFFFTFSICIIIYTYLTIFFC